MFPHPAATGMAVDSVAESLRTRFTLLALFNAWALSVVVLLVAALAAVAGTGRPADVPAALWIALFADAVGFAGYFTLSAPVAEFFERRGWSVPVFGRIGRRLEAWDEAGREE